MSIRQWGPETRDPRGVEDRGELAAHWQFADGSHFTLAFKKRYGQTPTERVRSARP